MAERYDRIPLIVDDSSTDIFERRELDVQQYESYKADNDDGRFVTVGGDVNIEKAGSSADGGDRTELVGEAEGQIKVRETLNTVYQQKLYLLRRGGDLARKAAYNSRRTTGCCLSTMQNTLYVLNVGKARVSEAIASAEKAGQFEEANRNGALANKYNVAIELVTKGIREIKAAAKSAESASITAYLTSHMISTSGENVDEVEEKLTITYDAANFAYTTAIVVNKTEYAAVKAVRKCLKDIDIDPELLEFEAIISQSEELAISRNTHQIVGICIFSAISFILGILLVASALTKVKGLDNMDNISIVTLGSIMVAIPVVYFLYRIFMYCRNKRREALDKINRNIIPQIDKRLLELEKYFESKNISPEDEEQ